MPKHLRHHLLILLMLLILLLATAARFHNLGEQSLWYDEGVAFGHSQRTLAEMIPRLQNNVHVPAYFGSLAVYENFVGHSEFGLRSYSVLWSIISVAAAYALGKRLFHPLAGIAAALFIALNSFSVYYAQETRMYAMLAAIATLSIWAFVRWAQLAFRPSANTKQLWLWGLAFAGLNVIGEYTHVSYALVMVSQGVMVVLLLANLATRAFTGQIPLRIPIRILLIYVVVNLLTIVLFAPWLLVAISQISAQPNISEVVDSAIVLRTIQGWFAFGRTFEEGMAGLGAVVYFILIFGLLLISDKRKTAWWMLILPVVWVLISVGAYLYLELYLRYLRFLLAAQVGFAVWLGRGIWVIWSIVPRSLERRQGWQRQATALFPKVAATLAMVALAWQQFVLLPPLYSDENYLRDDYRGLVQTIEAEAGETDAIVLSAPGLQEIFGYYYDASMPVYTLPASPDIANDTQAIIEQHERIYLVLFGQYEQDADGLVEATLNTETFQISSEWVGDVRFERYAAPANFPPSEIVDAQFGDNIILETVALSETTFNATDVVQVQFEWMTSAALDRRYKIFLQLLNSEGVLVAQRDSEPVGNQAPTTLWQLNESILDNHALAFQNLPSGDYTLIMGLYDIDNPELRLPVDDGDFLILETLTIR